jgi:cellulose synthase/poly-beta-1,6-N-acetylglucosamine synthase-like glycosyltransferase
MTSIAFWIIALLLIGGMISYILFLSIIYRGLGKVKDPKPAQSDSLPALSVIIPSRNEEATIGRTLDYLLNQNYPKELLQIIVVDDRSTDDTSEIVSQYVRSHPEIGLVSVTECPASVSPKKHALTEGIKHASGDIIITTDADCSFHPDWLSTMVRHFAQDVGIVAGLTRFWLRKEFLPTWQKMQWLDFISHSFVSAGAIGSGLAFNCNGSNLAYRRRVFDEVGGFSGVDRIVSGDDEFFAQKVNRSTSWKIRFATEPASIVLSQPVGTLKELFHQRFRWGSKGLLYQPFLKSILIVTYVYYLALLLTPISFVWWHWMIAIWAIALTGKVAMDLTVLIHGCRVFKIKRVMEPIVIAEILHIPMIILFATAGQLFSFKWKGASFRSVRKPVGGPVL